MVATSKCYGYYHDTRSYDGRRVQLMSEPVPSIQFASAPVRLIKPPPIPVAPAAVTFIKRARRFGSDTDSAALPLTAWAGGRGIWWWVHWRCLSGGVMAGPAALWCWI
jgi:hypothetical protein